MDGSTDTYEESDDYVLMWRRLDDTGDALTGASEKCHGDERMSAEFNRALIATSEAIDKCRERLYTIREWHHEIDPRKKEALAARIAGWSRPDAPHGIPCKST